MDSYQALTGLVTTLLIQFRIITDLVNIKMASYKKVL